MLQEVQTLLDRYRIWLRDKTTLRQVGEWIEITTPYLDRHNDCIQIYAKRADGGFVLTDDGYIIEDLEQSGCKVVDGGRRRALLDTTLNGFGVQINKTALEVRASSDNFALRKHNLVQAMLAVNDLFLPGVLSDRQPLLRGRGGLAGSRRDPIYAQREVHRQERL